MVSRWAGTLKPNNYCNKKIGVVEFMFNYLKDIFSRKKEPVYFITFHKTASSYFSKYILKQTVDFKHSDLATSIFKNQAVENINLEQMNTIYGPIRLSLDEGPVYQRFVEPILKQKILEKYQIICFIRDPRDIIISYYYSQAYSHDLSPNSEIKKIQMKNRKHALEIGIDQYAIEMADFLNTKFNILIKIIKSNDNSILLRYEDMIYDYDNFYAEINDFIKLKPETKEIIFQNTRPEKKGINNHRRNGEQGGYKNELKKETIVSINKKLKNILYFFKYT